MSGIMMVNVGYKRVTGPVAVLDLDAANYSAVQVDADIGFVKVWNSELTLAQIQAEHATYKARFGY